MHPEVAERIANVLRAGYVNPASQHRPGQLARRLLEDAREAIGHALGAQIDVVRPDQLIFTSGGTESNNLALFGMAGDPPSRLIVSGIEHPSLLQPARELARRGHDIQFLRVTADGVADLDHLRDLLQTPTRLVSLMAANNETGVLQPIEAAAELCAAAGVPLHVDAVQWIGKLPFDFQATRAALVTIAPHKFHGPVGIGALLVRSDCQVQPMFWGGAQQFGIRPGTESLALAVGFQAAIDVWRHDAADRTSRLAKLRNEFEQLLLAGWPEAVVIGGRAARAPHISNVAFPGFDRQALLVALDLAGIACSTGSACASGSSEPSPVHLAMGLPSDMISSALRFSVHALQAPSDAAHAAQRILQLLNDLRQRRTTREIPPPPRQPVRSPL